MGNAIWNSTGALSTFSVYPQLAGNLLRVGSGKSFTDMLTAIQTMTNNSFESENATWDGLELLRSLSGYIPTTTVEPETFADSDAYAKHLEAKFGMRVTAKYFKKDQESMDALGRSMNGNDLVIAPNILDEMAANRETASYYEAKIQYWFDNIPKWKAESAAMGLTYEPCGVAIHEDGTVYYIGGGTETPERKAQIEAAQKAQREKKLKRRREQQEYIQQLILQKQTNALAENWAGIFTPPSASSTMTQKILPNGAVFLATKTSDVKRENPQPVFETD
ncbi:MAG: hypothetical protein E7199_01235 [Schwartzia succinivorans]|nr:hypothetical protein [Schwartzia succinivorans]